MNINDLKQLSGLNAQKLTEESENRNIVLEVEEMLDELEQQLQEAIYTARQIKRLSVGLPTQISGQLEYYTIRHLESWISDENQPGSIASCRNMLNKI